MWYNFFMRLSEVLHEMPAVENYVPPPGLNLKWLLGRIRAGVHTTFLIVCNSNYIRSPFSEYILRRAFGGGERDFSVRENPIANSSIDIPFQSTSHLPIRGQ